MGIQQYKCECGWGGDDPEWVTLQNEEEDIIPICPLYDCRKQLEEPDCTDNCGYKLGGE